MTNPLTVQSRRERAEVVAAVEYRRAFGQFALDLERLGCLSELERRVAYWLGRWTLKDGVSSLDFSSLRQLSREKEGRRPFAGLGANDLSKAVMGERGESRGLAFYGIVLVDERSVVIEASMKRTIWSIVTDARLWSGVPANGWLCGADEVVEQLMHVRALRQWPTRALQGLQVEADLKDGLIAPKGDQVVPMASLARPDGDGMDGRGNHAATLPTAAESVDARIARLTANGPSARCQDRQTRQATTRPTAWVSHEVDARDGGPRGAEVAVARGRSEIQNAESARKAGGVLTVGMALKTQDSRPKLKNNLKSWTTTSIAQKKEALYELEGCTNDDRVRHLLEIIMGEDVAAHDAGKWIKARWTKAKQVQSAMTLLIEHMATGQLISAGAAAHEYGRREKIWGPSISN